MRHHGSEGDTSGACRRVRPSPALSRSVREHQNSAMLLFTTFTRVHTELTQDWCQLVSGDSTYTGQWYRGKHTQGTKRRNQIWSFRQHSGPHIKTPLTGNTNVSSSTLKLKLMSCHEICFNTCGLWGISHSSELELTIQNVLWRLYSEYLERLGIIQLLTTAILSKVQTQIELAFCCPMSVVCKTLYIKK